MDLRKILLILGLAVSMAAQASIVTEVEAVETVTSNISVPTSTNGRLMFRPCADSCEEKFIAVRLTTENGVPRAWSACGLSRVQETVFQYAPRQ